MGKAFSKSTAVIVMVGFSIAFMAGSCREECNFKPRSLAGIDFHTVINGADQHSPVDSLTVRGLGREDSLLYAAVNNVRTITLPMNGSAVESGFIIDFDRGTDTVWFSYEVKPWFLSPECGFILNFELLETRHSVNVIESVVIVNREITTFDDTNIRIYN